MTIIYDAYGEPYTPAKRPETREIAVTTIRDRWGTYPSSGLTPERLAAIFKEADVGDVYRQSELFEEMEEKDTHLFSVFQTRKLAVSGCDFKVFPYSDSPEDKKISEFVTEAISWIENWDEALLDMLDAISKGFSVSEIIWEISDGKVWVRELKWRHQKRFTFYDPERVMEFPRLLTQESLVLGEDLIPNKFIVHKYRARSGTTSRSGVLRTCAWMYLFKNCSIKDWVIFAEVYGMPLRLGKYDPAASKEDREVLIQAVQSLGTDAAGVISSNTAIEFVESVKNAQGSVYDLLVNLCNGEMSKAVVGQTLTTEVGTTGSLAAGQVHNEVRKDILEADGKTLAKTLRMQLIRPLVGFNFGWDKNLPLVKAQFAQKEDLVNAATVYKTLVDAGFDGIAKKHMHEKFNIPQPNKDDEILQPQRKEIFEYHLRFGLIKVNEVRERLGLPPLPGKEGERLVEESIPTGMSGGYPQPGAQGFSMKQFVGKQEGGGADKDALDLYIEKATSEADGIIEDMVVPIRELVSKAKSLEEIRDGLIDLYPDINTVDMGNLMQYAFTVAELKGRSEIRNA